jgi:hypothetical protein
VSLASGITGCRLGSHVSLVVVVSPC